MNEEVLLNQVQDVVGSLLDTVTDCGGTAPDKNVVRDVDVNTTNSAAEPLDDVVASLSSMLDVVETTFEMTRRVFETEKTVSRENGLEDVVQLSSDDEEITVVQHKRKPSSTDGPANKKMKKKQEWHPALHSLPGERFFRFKPRNPAECEVVKRARDRGILVSFSHSFGQNLPEYVASEGCIYWSVEVIFRRKHGDGHVDQTLMAKRVYEKDSIHSIVRSVVAALPGGQLGEKQLDYVMSQPIKDQGPQAVAICMQAPGWNGERFYRVVPQQSLADNLRHRLVKDRPKLLVMLRPEAVYSVFESKMLADDAAQATRDFFTTSLDRYRKAALKDAPPDARVRLLREFFLSLSTLTEAIMKTLPTRQIEDIRELMQPYFHFEPNHNTFLAKLWRQLSAFLNVSADMSAQRWLLASLNVRGLPSIMSEIQAATAARQPQSISTLGITRSLIDPVVGMPNGNNLATPTFINIPTLNPPLPGFHGATPPLVMSPVMPTVPTVRIFPQKPNHLSATPPLTFSHGATPPFAATSLATPPSAQSKTDEDCVVIKTVVRSAAPVQQQTNKATVGRVVLKYGDSPFYSNTASAMDRLMRVVPPQPIRVYREYLAQKDMVVLCTYRKLFQVSEQFTNTFSMKFFSRLGELTGLRLMEDVRLEPSPEGRGQVSWSSIHLFRTIRIVTVGQAKAPSMLSASAGAYAGMLCALCYLQVIPYEMLLALYGSQEIGRDWTDSVLYACRYRFRHLIMLCESLEFLQLSAFRGDLGDPIPDNILELLHRFNHRMRSTGSRFWSAYRVVKIPEGVSMPHPSTYPGTYFRFEQEEAVINWTVVLPEFGIGDPRIIECPLLVEDRYGEQPYEKGMAPVEQQQQCLIRCMITGASNWFCATTQMPMDWVVWLTARDFERRGPCSMWFNPINRRILDTIAEKWNKKLFRTHMLQQETDGNSTPWFHVTSVKFEGLPAFFLQGKGKHVEIGSSMGVSDSFLISSLCLMGIIPMELYSLIRIYGECWIEPVVYACRRRFAQFELLMRNSNFYRLFSQKEARFYHQPPRPPHHNLPVAYEFFQRMRAVATLYWTANPVIVLPKSIPIPKSRLSSAYFVFMHSDCEEEWSDMNPALGEVDTYPSVNKNRELENCYTRFHFDTKRWKSTADGVKESVLPAITPLSEASLATVRPSKFTPAALSIIRRFHTELALLAGSSFEATADKKEPNIVARAAFTGDISWLFNRSFVVTEGKMELDCAVSEAEFRLHRFLLRCRILPMGILDFITNNEERLPFVVQSLSGIMMKVVATAKAFLYYEGARPDRVACCQLARDCSMDWRSIRIILPAHLMPTFQEKKFFPSFPVAEQTEDQRTTQALFQELNLHLGAGNKALKSLQEECQPVINTENNRTLAPFDSDVDEEEDDVITSEVIPKGIVPWEKEGEETQTTDVMGGYGECPDGDDEYLD